MALPTGYILHEGADAIAAQAVSAIKRPAMIAPTIGDRPTALVARLHTITTNKLTETNSSGLLFHSSFFILYSSFLTVNLPFDK